MTAVQADDGETVRIERFTEFGDVLLMPQPVVRAAFELQDFAALAGIGFPSGAPRECDIAKRQHGQHQYPEHEAMVGGVTADKSLDRFHR